VYARRTLSIADEVFMDAYEQESKKMSPVSPFMPTAQIRQLDMMPNLPLLNDQQGSLSQHGLLNGSGVKKEKSTLQGWDHGMDRTIRKKLSFPSLHLPPRSSFLSRVASHLSPRSSPVQYQSPQRLEPSLQQRRDWPSCDEMMVDDNVSTDQQRRHQMKTRSISRVSALQSTPSLGHSCSNIPSDGHSNHHSEIHGTVASDSAMEADSMPDREASNSSMSSRQHQHSASLRGAAALPGISGAGVSLNLPPLRTVRSFSSHTSSRHGVGLPSIIHNMKSAENKKLNIGEFNDCLSLSNHLPQHQQQCGDINSFLQHDPFAASGAAIDYGNSDDAVGNSSLGNAPFAAFPSQARRGRSWSSIFKRKKVWI
jgi:hypothetical protein